MDKKIQLLKINKLKDQTLVLIREYFRLYKKPYPYFQITFEARDIEDQNIVDTMARIRLYGRSSFNRTHELIYPLFEEISRRLNLSVDELKFLTPKEIEGLLNEEELDVKEIIKERHKCVFIHSKGEVSFHEDATLTLHYHDLTEITELKGQGTFPGRYTGKVKLIKNKQDIEKAIISIFRLLFL